MSRLSSRHLRALACREWYMAVMGPLHVLRDVQPYCHKSTSFLAYRACRSCNSARQLTPLVQAQGCRTARCGSKAHLTEWQRRKPKGYGAAFACCCSGGCQGSASPAGCSQEEVWCKFWVSRVLWRRACDVEHQLGRKKHEELIT